MEQPSNSNNQEITLNEEALKQTLRLIHSEVKDMSSHIQEAELYRRAIKEQQAIVVQVKYHQRLLMNLTL